jgi:hypothetical protein
MTTLQQEEIRKLKAHHKVEKQAEYNRGKNTGARGAQRLRRTTEAQQAEQRVQLLERMVSLSSQKLYVLTTVLTKKKFCSSQVTTSKRYPPLRTARTN